MNSDTKALVGGDNFTINPLMTSGLTLFVRGGKYLHASQGLRTALGVILTLTASATNYVEMDDNGVITSNTTGFTSSYTPLYVVTTGTAEITGIGNAQALSGLLGRLDGAELANHANVNVIGNIPVIHRIDLAAGANADTDVILTHKTRVIDAFLILRGAGVGSETITIKNGASAITNALAASGSDQALVRATTIDDANYEIAAGGTLRVSSGAGASQPTCSVYVIGLRVA
jgi:hypothetical protein